MVSQDCSVYYRFELPQPDIHIVHSHQMWLHVTETSGFRSAKMPLVAYSISLFSEVEQRSNLIRQLQTIRHQLQNGGKWNGCNNYNVMSMVFTYWLQNHPQVENSTIKLGSLYFIWITLLSRLLIFRMVNGLTHATLGLGCNLNPLREKAQSGSQWPGFCTFDQIFIARLYHH